MKAAAVRYLPIVFLCLSCAIQNVSADEDDFSIEDLFPDETSQPSPKSEDGAQASRTSTETSAEANTANDNSKPAPTLQSSNPCDQWQILVNAGFEPGWANWIISEDAKPSLEALQAQYGLTVSGQVDDATLALLAELEDTPRQRFYDDNQALAANQSVAACSEPALTTDASTNALAIEEIIVTGEKLGRTLQETTSSVAVITAEDIADSGVRNIYDVFARTANINAETANNGQLGGFVIRGVSNNNVTAQNASSSLPLASIYVDGVALSRAGARGGPLEFWDVASIEILRGPQSTNQGQGAMAGAVIVNTEKPSADYSAKVRLTDGSFGQHEVAAAIGGKLAGPFHLRIAAQDIEREGTAYNPTRDEFSDYKEQSTQRIRLGFQPDVWPNVESILSFTHSENEFGQARINGDPKERQTESNTKNFVDTENTLASLLTTIGIGDYTTLTLINAAGETQLYNLADFNASADDDGEVTNISDDENTSHELRFTFSDLALFGKPVRGLVGAYSSDNRNDSEVTVEDGKISIGFDLFLNGQTLLFQNVDSESFFTEWEWGLPWNLNLITGARHESNSAFFAYESDYSLDPVAGGTGPIPIGDVFAQIATQLGVLPANGEGEGSNDSSAFLPKVGLRYDGEADWSLGLTWQKAYRAGGVSVNVIRGEVNTYEPEFTETTELSYRQTFADGLVNIRSNIYYTDWIDQQVNVQLSDDPNDARTENAGRSQLYGAELEMEWQFALEWQLFTSLGYAKTEFIDFVSTNGDFTGNEFPSAPERQGSIGIDYKSFNTGFSGQLSAQYRDASFRQPNNNPAERNDSCTTINGKFGWSDDQREISLTATNLLDETCVNQRMQIGGAPVTLVNDPQALVLGLEARF